MENIKIGDYVKIKNGDIRKIVRICEGKEKTIFGKYGLDKPYNNSYSVAKSKITKHSKNIMDLIEVGDIVEILLNLDTKATQKYEVLSQQMIDEVKKDLTSTEYLVSVLTRQQYENNCYKVVE